jgi:hypothetical protein
MRVEELTYEGIFLHEAPKEGEKMKIKGWHPSSKLTVLKQH